MVINGLKYLAVSTAMCVVFASAVAGCGGGADDGEDTAAIISPPLTQCPRNWVDPEFVQIDCMPGYVVLSIDYQGHKCVRCVPEPEDDDDHP
jgi:hypothetical protein